MAYYDDWPRYVSAADRRAQAARAQARLRKGGRVLSPVAIEGTAIARTFWGKSWCRNLERYSDFANRLPRGRSYVRSGAVVDLQIGRGVVEALVSGSDLYRVEVKVAVVPAARWKRLCVDCAGQIDSLIELLRGRLSTAIMSRLCEERTGLFPSPAEITFSCSCPDRAVLCKHVAAVLYGIGARLDAAPELLFVLRHVDQQDLVAAGGRGLAQARPTWGAGRMLETDDLSELFGIEIAQERSPSRRLRTRGKK